MTGLGADPQRRSRGRRARPGTPTNASCGSTRAPAMAYRVPKSTTPTALAAASASILPLTRRAEPDEERPARQPQRHVDPEGHQAHPRLRRPRREPGADRPRQRPGDHAEEPHDRAGRGAAPAARTRCAGPGRSAAMKKTSGTTMLASSSSRSPSSSTGAMIAGRWEVVGGSGALPPTHGSVGRHFPEVAAQRVALGALPGLRIAHAGHEVLDLLRRRRRQQRDDPDGEERRPAGRRWPRRSSGCRTTTRRRSGCRSCSRP